MCGAHQIINEIYFAPNVPREAKRNRQQAALLQDRRGGGDEAAEALGVAAAAGHVGTPIRTGVS